MNKYMYFNGATDWIPGSVSPVYNGLYQVRNGDKTGFAMYTTHIGWFRPAMNIEYAGIQLTDKPPESWRGRRRYEFVESEMTRWHGKKEKPQIEGLYLRISPGSHVSVWTYWNGEYWEKTVADEFESPTGRRSIWQDWKWRGLKEPHSFTA